MVLVPLQWTSQKLRPEARYRLVRRRWSRFKRRMLVNGLVLTYRADALVRVLARRLFATSSNRLATVSGVLIAGAFVMATDETFFRSGKFSAAEFHLACAGIMGTALALVLSLSIVPAQKAADVFSTAILELYARDRKLWGVFATLALLTLVSAILGTDSTFGVHPRWTVAFQLIVLGVALDALRRFYLRTLDLLIPQTALTLVRKECERLTEVMARSARRLAHIVQVRGGKHNSLEPTAAQWLSFRSSPESKHLIGWINQLEEFAHKALARRDTLAAKSALMTMATIGMHYADVRRDSIVLAPDFSGLMPTGVSDVEQVLNPIYESIKNLCEDAARQPNEAAVAACVQEFGKMAAHAMTIVHTQDDVWSTAPLSHSPVFYLKVCAAVAAKAQMDNALLAAVRAMVPFFGKISDRVQTVEAEAMAIDCLFEIALASYARRSYVPADEAARIMITVARHELKVRDFGYNRGLRTILSNLAALVPFEVVAEKTGQRTMQVFAPYTATGLRTLLIEEANKIKPEPRSWVDPFHDFNELSQAVVLHYRDIADKLEFDGTMLQRWIVWSALDCADVHMHLLADPPQGSERFLDNVENRLIWFIHAPSFFFKEEASFPYHYAEDAAGRLAILGMQLLRLKRHEATEACADAVALIGKRSASITKANARSVAGIFVKVEMLARAADAHGYPDLAKKCRSLEKRSEIVLMLPEYAIAIRDQANHLDESLAKHPYRDIALPNEPVPLLRQILSEAKALKTHRTAIINLLLNRCLQ